MKKKNLLMLVVILTAAYFSINGIMYERAVIENTMMPCCLNNQCNGADCDDPCEMGESPDEWTGTAMNCADYWDDGVHYCMWNEFCKYYGEFRDLDCDYPLIFTIYGPHTAYIPQDPNDPPVSYTWSANITSGSGTSYQWKYDGVIVGTGSSYTRQYSYTWKPIYNYHTLELTIDGITVTRTIREDNQT